MVFEDSTLNKGLFHFFCEYLVLYFYLPTDVIRKIISCERDQLPSFILLLRNGGSLYFHFDFDLFATFLKTYILLTKMSLIIPLKVHLRLRLQ